MSEYMSRPSGRASAEEGKAMVQLGQVNLEAVEEERIHDSLPIDYPDAAVARYCEERAMTIKGLLGRGVCIAAKIGAVLEEVKAILPRGVWGLWLERHFTWSEETARKYRGLARAVEENPRILELLSVELAIEFPSLPARTQEAILAQGAVRRRDALEIIERHMIEGWRTEIEELIVTDPGRAHHEITLAMDRPELRAAAVEMMRSHAEKFALLSDREPGEIMAEAGLTLSERLGGPPSGRVGAQLVEASDGSRLLLWLDGEVTKVHLIAEFPKPADPVVASWQAAVIQRAVEITGAATVDRLCGVAL